MLYTKCSSRRFKTNAITSFNPKNRLRKISLIRDSISSKVDSKDTKLFSGAVLKPLNIGAMPMLSRQSSVSGPLVVSPAAFGTMLNFAARHDVQPNTKSEDPLYYIDGVQKVLAGKDLEELEISLSPLIK